MLGFSSSTRGQNGKSQNKNASPTSHREILLSATYLMEQRIISKNEYFKIIQADLKYRADEAMRDACFENPFEVFQTQCHDKTDPITLEPLGEHTFSTGGSNQYNIESIIQYFISTGDFRDPITRIPLLENDLIRLDTAAELAGYKLPKLYIAYKQSEQFYISKKLKESTILSMEACLGLLVTEMTKVAERKYGGKDQSLIDLTKIFSEFEPSFYEFKCLDLEAAYQAWSGWIGSVIGPKLRPNYDQFGDLNSVVLFLKGQWSPQDDRNIKILQLMRSDSYDSVVDEFQSFQDNLQTKLCLRTETVTSDSISSIAVEQQTNI